MKLCPPVDGLVPPCKVWCNDGGCKFPLPALSVEGRGLLRRSLTAVVEEVGVPPAGDIEGPIVPEETCDGEDVPEVPSFFFEDPFESFARDSCSC